MKVTFLGHSCFLLEGKTGPAGRGGSPLRVLMDPYQHGAYGGQVRYRPVDREAEVVTVSHAHPDHGYAAGVPGHPRVLSTPGEHRVGDASIRGVEAYHDKASGAERGKVVIFRVALGQLAAVHLGDLGHELDRATAQALLPVDLLFLPVGGRPFTVSLEEAERVRDLLRPRVTIPMHYKTAGVDFPILPVEEFLRGKEGAVRPGSSTLELVPGSPPPGAIVVLEPALLP